MKVVIIKYNSGNNCSVAFALERIGIVPLITDEVSEISNADRVIFPGVGEASSAMGYLKNKKLDRLIPTLQQPVLGICLGMQLMCNYSEEGNTSCLGIFEQQVKKFTSKVKVPQIGWNTVYNLKSSLFDKIETNSYMYFVHSYFVEKGINTAASTDYEITYSAALQKENFYATQFHPEKSGVCGQRIIENFIRLKI